MPKKDTFYFSMSEFLSMSEVEGIIKIHEHPSQYYDELKRRQRTLERTFNRNFDGLVKNKTDAIITGPTGQHSDPTARAALNELEYTALFEDCDANTMKMVDLESSPQIKGIITLKMSLLIYETALELFPEDVRDILYYRIQNEKIDSIVRAVNMGKSYVTNRITKSYKEIREKAVEAAGICDYVKKSKDK